MARMSIDLSLPEADLLALSQEIKAEMADLRDVRRSIARELERRDEARMAAAERAEIDRLSARLAARTQRLAPGGAGANVVAGSG